MSIMITDDLEMDITIEKKNIDIAKSLTILTRAS